MHAEELQKILERVASDGAAMGIRSVYGQTLEGEEWYRPENEAKSLAAFDAIVAGTHPSGVSFENVFAAAIDGVRKAFADAELAVPYDDARWDELARKFTHERMRQSMLEDMCAMAKARVFLREKHGKTVRER